MQRFVHTLLAPLHTQEATRLLRHVKHSAVGGGITAQGNMETCAAGAEAESG